MKGKKEDAVRLNSILFFGISFQGISHDIPSGMICRGVVWLEFCL